MANQVRPLDLYAILDEERDDPLNFHRGSVYHKGSFGIAARNFGRLVWAVGKKAITKYQLEWPDILARSGDDMPSGFFSLAPFEAYVREALKAKGLSNSFRDCPRPLLVPAIDLDRAERVVFGTGAFVDVPISQAIAASAAIPGFFEPYRIDGHDYIDGDVGHTGHADLAVDRGASVLVVLNPAVPLRVGGSDESEVRHRGMYAVMEQAGHITSIKLLDLGLQELRLRHPGDRGPRDPAGPGALAAARLVDGLRGEPRRPALRLHLGEGLPRRRGRRAPPPPLRHPRRLDPAADARAGPALPARSLSENRLER